MINITFNPSEYALEVTGHAGQDVKGHDIVCSAMSMLLYTLAQAITESERMLEESPTVKMKDGNGYIKCRPKKLYEGNIARSYWTVLCGIELLAAEYPQYITFRVKENKVEG